MWGLLILLGDTAVSTPGGLHTRQYLLARRVSRGSLSKHRLRKHCVWHRNLRTRLQSTCKFAAWTFVCSFKYGAHVLDLGRI